MKHVVSILLFGLFVVVTSKPLERDALPEETKCCDGAISNIVPDKRDSEGAGSKDELEGAESAYLGFPYYYPYVYKYPVIIYGK